MNELKNIIFVCKFNQTRSQIARGLFEKLNKNKNYRADSVGIIKGFNSKSLKRDLKVFFKSHRIKHKKPKQLSKKILKGKEYIIIVADNVPVSLFDSYKKSGVKVIHWKIKDAYKYNEETRFEKFERIYEVIEKRMKKFVFSLDKA